MTEVNDDESYVIVELPLRLRPVELAQLRQALLESTEVETAGDAPLRVKPLPANGSSRESLKAQRDYAQQLIGVRRRRERELGIELFADPAWDILLDLFVQQVDGNAISVSSACYASSAPATTALRHLTNLIESGLVGRRTSHADKRRQYVFLTDEGFTRMERVLAAV